jgi:hypothetical protein
MKTSLKMALHCKVCAAISALLIGLTTSAHAEPPSNRAEPCLLVTAADAQASVGVAMGQPKGMDDGLYRHCTYDSANGRFYLYVSTFGDDEASFEKGRQLTAQNSRTVSGLGAKAYSDEDRHMVALPRL